MPDVRVKIDFFFRCGSYGWTETQYQVAPSVLFAINTINDLSIKRAALLNQSCFFYKIRCSDDLVFRDSLVKVYSDATAQGTFVQAGGITQPQPWTCLLCRVEAGATRRRAYDLRGLPSLVVDQLGNYINSAAGWTNAFNRWRTALIDGNYRIRTQTSSPAPPDGGVPISGIIPTAINPLSIDVTLPIAIPIGVIQAGAFVRISKVQGLSNIKGMWRIASFTGPNTFRTYPKRKAVTGLFSPGGTLRVITIDSALITAVLPVRGDSRDTGRPSDQRRGRRSQAS